MMWAAEGEPVDDGGGEPGVGEGLAPLRERGVGGDRHRRPLLALGEYLEEQLGAAPVELQVAELVEAEIGMRAGLLLTADTRLRREHGLTWDRISRGPRVARRSLER